ncbi:B30.2/SPRY domain-containing protein [Fusarium sp. LHS14.1]|nr:B30.2/SPRY domain-containing protein [Fusarium sp. LHS14.1]
MLGSSTPLPTAVVLLLVQGVVAAEGSAEFTLNVFTDIAPILALFGEQFAQQYLSQSFTWLDHLIFACVPLGIITALAGAIRTRGPRLARSFIGRARENLATVEIGLMSSVSHEVCEMFNGSGIVRTLGRSTLMQIIIFPDVYDAVQTGASDDPSCGIHTLQTALRSGDRAGFAMVRSKYQGKAYQRLQRLWDPENIANKDPHGQLEEPFDFKCPPNLQLNVSTGQSSRSRKTAELFVASITGITLQLSLFAIAAAVAYHERTSKVVGSENHPYGFPCYTVGSVLLCVGMAICSAAVESSTDEFVWTPSARKEEEEEESKPGGNSQQTHNTFVVWIQQSQSVGDQTFDSYAILGGSKPYVLTSTRSKDLWTMESSRMPSRKGSADSQDGKRRWWETITLVGVLLGSMGFIVQFIGLRGLPWPVAVSQLLAILVMALVRAVIRRGVGIIPLACEALPSYELDFVATRIVFYPGFREFNDGDPANEHLKNEKMREVCRWRVITASEERRLTPHTNSKAEQLQDDTGSRQESRTLGPQAGSSQQLVNVRERLGDLCKWKSSVSQMAVALAQSVEHFMNVFFEKLVSEEQELDKIIWTIEASDLWGDGNDAKEDTTVLIENKNGKWVAELGKIEAIMSLWMASMQAEHLDIKEKRDTVDSRLIPQLGDWRRASSTKVKFGRIVGDFGKGHSTLKRDISWWVGDHIVSECQTKHEASHQGGMNDSSLLIGFDTPAQGNLQSRGLSHQRMIHSPSASLPSVMAQHLFTSFTWVISERMPKNSLHQGESNAQDFVKVNSDTAFDPDNLLSTWDKHRLNHSKLSSMAKELESAGLGMSNDILLCVIPALSYRDLLPNEMILGLMPSISQGIRQYGWQQMAWLYNQLLTVCSGLDGERFAMAVLVDTIEFIILCSESHELIDKLGGLPSYIAEKFPQTLTQLAPCYKLQNRQRQLYELFRRCGFGGILPKAMLPGHNIIEEQELFNTQRSRNESMEPDIFGWTSLHYVASVPAQERTRLTGKSYRAIWKDTVYSCLDKSQRSAFHVAASSGYRDFLATCFNSNETDARRNAMRTGGLDGKTPLHLAVEGQHLHCVRLFLRHQAPCVADIWGRTPIHTAALKRNYEIGKELLARFPDPLQVDELRNTPLTYLLRDENDLITDQSRRGFAKQLMATWKMARDDDGSGNSLLHYAAAFSDEHEVESLVEELGNVESTNTRGQTPLHLAILEGRTVVAKKLISLGAQAGRIDDRGWNALHYAADCRGAEPEIVSLILNTQRDTINTTTKKSLKTPLHMAAAAGNASAAMILASEGAELNARDKDGDTPLQSALKKDQKEAIDELLYCFGALDSLEESRLDGLDHVGLAIRRCNTECLRTVLLHATTTTSMRIHGLKAMITSRDWKADDAGLFGLVLGSIPERHLSILDLYTLIHLFPSTTTSDALDQAWASRLQNLEALKEDPQVLHVLAQNGDISTIRQLLEADADASRLDEDNWMPSDVADRCGQTATGDLLREHLARNNVDLPNRPPYRVPESIHDIYRHPDIRIKNDSDDLEYSHSISTTLTNPGLPSAMFRTQECIPPNVAHYYFEAQTWGQNKICEFYIGFCSTNMPRGRLPGHHPGSWSYEISNTILTAWAFGEKHSSSQTIESDGQYFNVGCGLNMLTGEGFVTLNGKRLNSGTVFGEHKFSKGKIYPCVAFSTDRPRGLMGARVILASSQDSTFLYTGPYS